jgi:hypothetical protein
MIQFHNGWEHDLKVGQDGESEFSNLLRKNRPFYTVECKRDMRVHETGNLFIEVESRGNASGIEHTQADYWAFMTHDKKVSIVVDRDTLQKVLNAHEGDKVKGGDDMTSKGYLIQAKQLISSILHYVEA